MLKFDLNKLTSQHLLEVNRKLMGFDTITIATVLTKLEQMKHNPDEARKQPWLTAGDERLLDRDILPPFILTYCIQQALYLGDLSNKKDKPPPTIFDWLNEQFLEKEDQLFYSDFLPKEARTAALCRRYKNQQFQYYLSSMQRNIRLFRTAKIIDIGENNKEYDYQKSFHEISGGFDYKLFLLCASIVYHFMTNDLSKNAITKEIFLKTHGIKKFEEKHIDEFLRIIAFSSVAEFREAYDKNLSTYASKLTDDVQDGEKIYYDMHSFVPSIFRFKPLLKINEKDYYCPSPHMLEIFLNDFLFEVIRLKELEIQDDSFLKWFGDSFEKYCLSVINNTGNKDSNIKVFTEKEIHSNVKRDKPQVSDITVLVDGKAILFECKTLTPRVQGLITGRASGNKNEWTDMQDKLSKAIKQIYGAVKTFKEKQNLIGLEEEFKNVNEYFPIIVTYSSVFDINTKYKHEISDCLYRLDIKELEELERLGLSKHRCLVLSVYEFELLIELLHKNKKHFWACIEKLFSLECFKGKVLPGKGPRLEFTPEPLEVIFEFILESGIRKEKQVWQHEQGDNLRNYFNGVYKEIIDDLILVKS